MTWVSGSTLFLLVVLLLFSGRQPGLHAPLQIARAPLEELVKDLHEVEALLAASERSAVRQVLQSHKSRVEQQIERQTDLIRSGEKMLRTAANEMNNEHFEHARVSLSAARSAFTRASASDRLLQVDEMESHLQHVQEFVRQRIQREETLAEGWTQLRSGDLKGAIAALAYISMHADATAVSYMDSEENKWSNSSEYAR